MNDKRKNLISKAQTSFKILPEDVDIFAIHTKTILESILEAHIEIDHSCGGMGTCGTCRVFVLCGLEKMNPRNELESEMAQDRQFSIHERLSCQNQAIDGLVLKKVN